ncbi:MAG: GNAT family N-acetyltransferase [Muribaculaceae bacterium]|nr:GNAT family N-acetyltransferase [Muribaculaceae bacterium]
MNEDISIRLVKSSEDFSALVQLYEEVWPNVDYDKRVKANFVLNESDGISYCAELGEKIVGSRTSFGVNFYYGNVPVKTVQVGDSCVHPVCRGKGLFLKMNQAFLKDYFSQEYGGQLIYNISVLASRKAYEKLGWKYIESLAGLMKLARPFHILSKIGIDIRKLSGGINWDSHNDKISIDDALIDKREQTMRSLNVLHTFYDKGTIEWRGKTYSGIRQLDVEGIGSVIYKIGTLNKLKVILIGEVFLYEYNKKNYKKLEKTLCKAHKPDIIRVSLSCGHPLAPIYLKSGFMYNPKQKFLHHGVRVESDEMKKIAYNPMNWAISSIDIDTF